MPEFDKLLIFKALRPDRLTAAMARFVSNNIGSEFTMSHPYDLERSYQVCFAILCAPLLSNAAPTFNCLHMLI